MLCCLFLLVWSRRRRYREEFDSGVYTPLAKRPIVVVGKLPVKYITERMIEDIFKNKLE